MLKHQPFGWIRHKYNGAYGPIQFLISEYTEFKPLFNNYIFADGTPFGIKEE